MKEAHRKAIPIVEGKLYALGGVAQTDGALTWVPKDEKAPEPINAYALIDEAGALVVDTGVAAHEELVVTQLASVVTPDTPLSVVFTRFEGDTLTNLGPILRNFNVKTVIGGGVSNPFDFFDDLSSEEQVREEHSFDLTRMRGGENIDLGPQRQVQIISTSIRNLTTSWLYDPDTKTLFTSDAFGYEPLPSADRADLLVTKIDKTLDLSVLAPRMFTKFDWMLQAHVQPLLENLRSIFETREVEVIAPTHGRVIQGRAAVNAYYQATIDLLTSIETGEYDTKVRTASS